MRVLFDSRPEDSNCTAVMPSGSLCQTSARSTGSPAAITSAAATGLALLLLSPFAALALAGFVLIGFGASNIVPVLFSLAGQQQHMPTALAIASVTTVGYAGILLGPALVGGIAHLIGLPAAFWMLAALTLTIPLSAAKISRS